MVGIGLTHRELADCFPRVVPNQLRQRVHNKERREAERKSPWEASVHIAPGNNPKSQHLRERESINELSCWTLGKPIELVRCAS